MKKLFFFAAAAIGMLAGCQKQNEEHSVNEDAPVAMQLGATTATYAVTKAAVNEWDVDNGTTVFVYGLKNTENGYVELYSNYETMVKDPATALEIYDDDAVDPETPYFYGEGLTYDFFGYYKGGAAMTLGTLTNNEVSHTVTFDGSHDLMYAHTDKGKDILRAAESNPKANDVTFTDVYSAWAARRDVQPNLIFKHALSKFNFIVRGMNESSEDVTITSVTVKSVNTGALKVVGDINTLGFTADPTATQVELKLKNADDSVLSELEVVKDVEQTVGAIPNDDPSTPEVEMNNNASLMVAPNMAELEVVVAMRNNKYTDYVLPEYKFTVKAADVIRTDSETMTAFKAGEAYNIYINVYGPEEIKVTATLTKWTIGGNYTYDPDNEKRPGLTEKLEDLDVEASVAVVDNQAEYDAFYAGSTAPTWDEANASGTLPWAGFKVDARDVDQTLYVKCKYNGSKYVEFQEPKGQPWYEIVGPTKIKVVVPANSTIVSFEVKDELGIDSYVDGDTFEFEVERVVNE